MESAGGTCNNIPTPVASLRLPIESRPMKVTCPRDALLAACQLVQGAVAPRTTKPVLANIKAVAQDDALILMATDTEIGIAEWGPVD